MDLIDRYVHEVGQHLPRKLRADVAAEVQSLLMDGLDERARAAGRPPDDGMAAEVLRAWGNPREVAARYAGRPQYLIGPRLFPAYALAIRIMLGVLGGILATLVVFRAFSRGADLPLAPALVRAYGSFFSGALFNLGLLTLVFAIVERTQWRREAQGRDWSPATLPPVKDPDRVSIVGRVFLLYVIAALAVLFNLYPQWVSVVVFHNRDVQVYPLLLPEFARYLPLLNAFWALAFVLNLVVLRQGRWRRPTRWAETVLEAANAVLLIVIAAGPVVFNYDLLVKLVLQVFAVIAVIRAGAQLVRLLRPRPAGEPWRTGSSA